MTMCKDLWRCLKSYWTSAMCLCPAAFRSGSQLPLVNLMVRVKTLLLGTPSGWRPSNHSRSLTSTVNASSSTKKQTLTGQKHLDGINDPRSIILNVADGDSHIITSMQT